MGDSARLDIGDWFEDNKAELAQFVPTANESLEQRVSRGGALLKHLHRHGIMGRGWPESWGGQGGTVADRAHVYDEIVRAGLDLPEAVAPLEVLGSALAEFAPDLAQTHVRNVLEGTELWCQGFSEPEAGSDLASLRTRAVRDGDGWSLTGQKVWTSLGHLADWCGVLARTGEPSERHRGLTLFWVNLKSPGVDARPLQTLTGEAEFSEVFLDEVQVPDDLRIGEVGAGWKVAMHLLQYERGMWAWQRQALLHAVLEEAVVNGGEHLDDRDLGNAYALLQALRSRSGQTVLALSRGESLGPDVSIDKILLGRAEQTVNDLARQAHGESFAFSDDESSVLRRGAWFYSRASTIYGGAVEVQLDLVAQRVLGLPRSAR